MFLSYIATNELTQKCLIYMIFKMPVNHYISYNPRLSLLCDEDQLFIKTDALRIDFADICGRKPLYYCK